MRTRKNLLLWYTADEPDGWGDPLNATTTAYNLITSLDGGDGRGGSGYHPISLVLNCENYEFTTYSSGADIIMTDAYTIGNNVTFSTEWGTECTEGIEVPVLFLFFEVLTHVYRLWGLWVRAQFLRFLVRV